jgi:hypothetical protein
LRRKALDMRRGTTDGGICRRCQHLLGNPICFLFQRVVARAYGELGLKEFLALAFRAFASQ